MPPQGVHPVHGALSLQEGTYTKLSEMADQFREDVVSGTVVALEMEGY